MSKRTVADQIEQAAQRADDMRDDMPKLDSAYFRRRVIRKDAVINKLLSAMQCEEYLDRRLRIYKLIKDWQKSREVWLVIHYNEVKDELRNYPNANALLYQVIVVHAQELQLLT